MGIELIVVGLAVSPYLLLIIAEIRDRLTDDGSRKYRLRHPSYGRCSCQSEWEHILAGGWG